MDDIKISKDLFYKGIWTYLNSRPFAEVEGLIHAIRKEVQPQEESAEPNGMQIVRNED